MPPISNTIPHTQPSCYFTPEPSFSQSSEKQPTLANISTTNVKKKKKQVSSWELHTI